MTHHRGVCARALPLLALLVVLGCSKEATGPAAGKQFQPGTRQPAAARAQAPKLPGAAPSESFRWDGRYLSRLGPQRITIDGDFSDWDSIPALEDPPNDTSEGATLTSKPNPDADIRVWKFTHDAGNLYLCVEVAPKGKMLVGAPDAKDAYFLMAHLDVDNNSSTGFLTFDPTLKGEERHYSDWYAPSRIGSDYAFEIGYADASVHEGAKPFRTFMTYWGAGDDRLGRCTYEGMKEIRFGVPVAKFSGNKFEMGCPFEAFGGHVKAGTVMDVAVSIETAGEAAGTGWCQDSTEAIEDYVVTPQAEKG